MACFVIVMQVRNVTRVALEYSLVMGARKVWNFTKTALKYSLVMGACWRGLYCQAASYSVIVIRNRNEALLEGVISPRNSSYMYSPQ